jgi:parvulin-like peptidyl-prolyl isomerase
MIIIRTILLISFFVFQNCGGASKNEAFLAKVGESTLLSKDIPGSLPGDLSKTPALISQWVAEEILFENASDAGFTKGAMLKSSSERFQRRLVGQRFLQHLAGQNITVSSEEVLSYYNEEIDGFKRTKKGAKIYHLFVESRAEANKIVHDLSGAGKKTKKNDLFLQYALRPASGNSGSLIHELEEAIFSKKSQKQLLGPIKSSLGYHVLFILERFNAGSAVTFEEVYDEIYQRIFQQKLSLKSLHILDSLRNHTSYLIN